MISFYNLALFAKIFCRLSAIFIEKTTFDNIVEICEQKKFNIMMETK